MHGLNKTIFVLVILLSDYPVAPMTKVLEINLISAQNLKPPSRNKIKSQIYAVVWIDTSSRKLRTKTDSSGAENPTWNDKFLFQVSPDFLASDTSGVNVDIYAVRPFKDSLIGTSRCLLSSCLGKFTPVYVHRPSGSFQGILNIAASLVGDVGADMEIFQGCPSVSFHDLTTRANPKNAEKEKEKGWGRLRMVRSWPSLSSPPRVPSTPTKQQVPKLRLVRSDPSIYTLMEMLSPLAPSTATLSSALSISSNDTGS